MRMRKKKNLIPRMEKCAAVHVKDGFAVNPKRKLLKLCREKQLPVLTWK